MSEDEELAEFGSPDVWAAHFPGRELVPRYLVSRFAAQYRVIVEVLLEAQDTSLTGVAFDELAGRIREYLAARVTPDAVEALTAEPVFLLDARLDSLVRWSVLTRWQDAARSGEDFLRRRDRYQLTPEAARLHAFWSSAREADADAAADLTLAPRAIGDRLATFADALRDGAYRAAAAEYQQIIVLHQGMAAAARTWQRSLAHAMSGGPDPGKQDVLWQTLKSYIALWGEQVDVHTPRVAGLLAELGPLLTERTWSACIRAALADEAAAEVVAAQVARWSRTWDALVAWFAGTDGQARRLRRQLRDLVAPWARNANILLDTGGAVTRRAELLALAVTIERAPDEATAWRLWDTAVGIFPARHLLIPAEPADLADQRWAQAPAAPVMARFREQGAKAAVGRRANAPDYAAGRTAARRERAAARAARAEAEAGLRVRSGTRLSAWAPVSAAELEFALELLGVARRADGRDRSAVTADGRWRVRLTVPPSGPTTAVLRGPTGRLVTPDWEFRLEPAR